jgi:hypothetical protein
MWSDREFQALSEYIITFFKKYFESWKYPQKLFLESDDEGAFDMLEFIFRGQIQFKTYICRVVENFMGYPNI